MRKTILTIILLSMSIMFWAIISPSAKQLTLNHRLNWENFLDIVRVGSTHIWAVGIGGIILSSQDGGKHWHKQHCPVDYEWLQGVSFSDSSHGWIAGSEGTILSTTNGGETWSGQHLKGAHLMDVLFLSPRFGLTCGLNGQVFRTENGGSSWALVNTPTKNIINKMTSFQSDKVWAVGGEGLVLRSLNGGKSWENLKSGSGELLYDVCFVDAFHGWICGRAGTVRYTADGGLTWESRKPPTNSELCAIFFIDQKNGVTVGGAVHGDSPFYTTTDGGLTWHKIETGFETWWKAIHCNSQGECLVVGHDLIMNYTLE
ncbi:WD40/YVTN/BNR-like repeat-containing protein [candidate division CSSED10-310 bacterium]|uniref:WD40/YVTN/BNR-like repeat-containing protein n=1 Tax=candidate division CSSED10-310 bacterium TaxID=2855610 RepID=A0ABV6Z3Y4_UNCC1